MELSLLCGANIVVWIQENISEPPILYSCEENSKNVFSCLTKENTIKYTNIDVFLLITLQV